MAKVTKQEVLAIRRAVRNGDDFYEDAPEYVEILLDAVRYLERQGSRLPDGPRIIGPIRSDITAGHW